MYKDWFINSVKEGKRAKIFEKGDEKALMNESLLNGQGIYIEQILKNYRTKETKAQKEQRLRLSIGRSKHIINRVTNVINQLDIMDKPALNVLSEIETHTDMMLDWVYDNNINELAFSMVRDANIIDANRYVICRIDENNEVVYQTIRCENIFDIKVVNGQVRAIVFRFKKPNENVYEYECYENNVIRYIEAKASDETERIEGFNYREIQTTVNHCFSLGIRGTSELKDSLLEPASELFKQLIQQGSDFDVDLATHGLIQKFAYVTPCTHKENSVDGLIECNGGRLYQNGADMNHKCGSCNGSGYDTHTSSQDIIHYPLPSEMSTAPKLSDLVHTISINSEDFRFRDEIIKRVEDEILNTVFSNTQTSRQEISEAVTATEKVIDLQGVYATLNQIGKKISDCFIWMCECKAAFEGYKKVSVIHGYTLSLKLESVETLAAKLKTLTESGAPSDIINSINLAMLQKQHIDSPVFLNRYIVWERYRPFKNKHPNNIMVILAGLNQTNYYKVLYNFFDDIKANIIEIVGDTFYEMKPTRQKELIDIEVKKIQDILRQDEPERLTFEFEDEA